MSWPPAPPVGPSPVPITGDVIVDGTITNADVDAAAAIEYSKLDLSGQIVDGDVSASAAVAKSKIALTGSIVNADIGNAAAIAYSKLSLGNSIVNGDVSASAAIAYSKLNLASSIQDTDLSNPNQYLKSRANGATNQAVARAGGQNASSSGTSGRIEYFPWIIDRTITLKELRIDVTASSTAGTVDVGLYPNSESSGIWTPGTKIETIATGLSLTTTGVRVQAWTKTLTPGIYWTGVLYLGITGGPPQTRACGGFLPFIPQQNASSSHAAGLAETGLSSLPTTPAAAPTNTPVACPALILN